MLAKHFQLSIYFRFVSDRLVWISACLPVWIRTIGLVYFVQVWVRNYVWFVGKRGKLAIIGNKGMKTLQDCSVKRKDGLESRVTSDGDNAIHEKCRKIYTKKKNVLKASVHWVGNKSKDALLAGSKPRESIGDVTNCKISQVRLNIEPIDLIIRESSDIVEQTEVIPDILLTETPEKSLLNKIVDSEVIQVKKVCLICGKGRKLRNLGVRALNTILECSKKRKDVLDSRIMEDAQYFIHENCRKRYTKVQNVLKATRQSIENCDVFQQTAECLTKDRTVLEQDNRLANNHFNWKEKCVICVGNLKKYRFKFILKVVEITDKKDHDYFCGRIKWYCENTNDLLPRAVYNRIASVNLCEVGAKYHQSCLDWIYKHNRAPRKWLIPTMKWSLELNLS